MSEAPNPAPPPALDTDDTRGHHLRRLLTHPVTLSLGATLAIGGFVAGTLIVNALIGLLALVAVILLVLLVAFALASSAAKEDFFRTYADARGLKRTSGKSSVPPLTPLLRKGQRRYIEQRMQGTLPGGMAGSLGLYTYEVDSTDSKGNRNTSYYRFTTVLFDLPEVARHVSDLYCQRRSGFRFMDGAEDVFRRMRRLELESEAHDKRYEVFFGPEDDEIWMKRLFSPSFIVWLAHDAPSDFAFELSAGTLCVNVKNHHDSAVELDELCEAATAVAGRLVEEAAQTSLRTP